MTEAFHPQRTNTTNVHSLRGTANGSNRPPAPQQTPSHFWIGGLFIAAAAAAVVFLYESPGEQQGLPENGTLTLERPLGTGERTAPFSVISSPDESEASHFVKLSDWDTEAPVASVFVRGGQTAKAELPFGNYRVTIAQGKTWYGPSHLFGNRTAITEGLFTSKLYQSGPNQTTGVTLTLAPRVAGNYPTRPVSRSSFNTAAE
jgi:hypothetical protein